MPARLSWSAEELLTHEEIVVSWRSSTTSATMNTSHPYRRSVVQATVRGPGQHRTLRAVRTTARTCRQNEGMGSSWYWDSKKHTRSLAVRTSHGVEEGRSGYASLGLKYTYVLTRGEKLKVTPTL